MPVALPGVQSHQHLFVVGLLAAAGLPADGAVFGGVVPGEQDGAQAGLGVLDAVGGDAAREDLLAAALEGELEAGGGVLWFLGGSSQRASLG